MNAPSSRALPLVLLLGLLWGFNWPAVRIALDEIAPWTLRTLGMSAAGIALMALALATGRRLVVPRREWPYLALGGLLSIAAFNILLAFAQLLAPTSRAAILTYTMPLWAVLLSRIWLGEALERRRLTGLGLGMAGLAALGLPLMLRRDLPPGLLLALLAGMSWACGTVVAKRWPLSVPPLSAAAWQLLLGGAAAALGMLAFEGLPVPKPLSPRVTLALAYHILAAQALAYVLWFAVILRLPAGLASIGTLAVPAVGVAGSVLLLGERPSATDWLGLLLVTAAAASILIPAGRKAH